MSVYRTIGPLVFIVLSLHIYIYIYWGGGLFMFSSPEPLAYSISMLRHFLTLAQGRVHTKFKPDFFRNYCVDLNQTFYECFQVQGNENLMT